VELEELQQEQVMVVMVQLALLQEHQLPMQVVVEVDNIQDLLQQV
jgi:hypothetical protein